MKLLAVIIRRSQRGDGRPFAALGARYPAGQLEEPLHEQDGQEFFQRIILPVAALRALSLTVM
jgi:hypothetical protein